jgi:hypothetical protein
MGRGHNINTYWDIDNVPIKLYTCSMDEIPDYIAYQGDIYQIEFYYDEKGNSQPRTYMENMKPSDAKKFAHLLQMMGDVGEIRNNKGIYYEDNTKK